MSYPHASIRIWVMVDVDVGIASVVSYLQTFPDVRTHTSCEGAPEGDPISNPYRPYVMVTWETPEALERLRGEFDVDVEGNGRWGYVHPRPKQVTVTDRTT